MINIIKNRSFQVIFTIAIISISAYAYTSTGTTVNTTASSDITTTGIDIPTEKTAEVTFENNKDEIENTEIENSDNLNSEDTKNTDNTSK